MSVAAPPRPGDKKRADVYERKLLRRWHMSQDRRARDELVERYLWLARTLAFRYVGAEPLEDLVQVASLGLLKAVDRYDPQRGSSIKAFAAPYILGELKKYFRDKAPRIHLERPDQELAMTASRFVAAQEARGHPVTAEAMAELYEISIDQARRALLVHVTKVPASFGMPTNADDPNLTLGDMFGDPKSARAYEKAEISTVVHGHMRRLPKKWRMALILRFVEDLTQAEIGCIMGCSQMQVSRIIRLALNRLSELVDDSLSSARNSSPDRG